MAQQNFRVNNAAGMWIRTTPVVSDETQIVLLPNGHLVTKTGDSQDPNWWRVKAVYREENFEGVSKKTLMVPDSEFTPPTGSDRITEVHMRRPAPVNRDQRGTEAFRLNEEPQPRRDPNGTSAQKTEQLGDIIEWLNVSQKRRYRPTETATYCNIYAYDYSCLAGAFMPRVWWLPTAIQRLLAGQTVNPIYNVTIGELTANQLSRWFREYGSIFGWRQTNSLTDLQLAANAGAVCLINARKIVGHGHIAAIAPETNAHHAEWDNAHTRVIRPLTSQAGRLVFEYRPYVWWNDNYRDLGFWIHD
jgi:hypothetical protein